MTEYRESKSLLHDTNKTIYVIANFVCFACGAVCVFIADEDRKKTLGKRSSWQVE